MVLLPSTVWGKEIAGRVAVRTGCGLVTDVNEFDFEGGGIRLWKSALSNSEHVEIRSITKTTIVTLQPGMHRAAPQTDAKESLPQSRSLQVPHLEGPIIEFIEEFIKDDLERIATAKFVLGIGLGASPDEFPIIREFASSHSGEIVGTRKVTDKRLLPRSRQVGATGRLLSSPLYLVLGISGRLMHVVGLNAVNTVLAINSGPGAAIFEHCDFGLIGTWMECLEALKRALTHTIY